MKLIIVSNRLPFTLEKTAGGLSMKQSVGGVATGLHSYISQQKDQSGQSREVVWFGSPGQVTHTAEATEIGSKLAHYKSYHPVFIPDELYKGFYSQCCNENIYPLFTGFFQHCNFSQSSWECYKKVNRLYSHIIAKKIAKGDVVWVNDYHFLLLPFYLRELVPTAAIGFFLHIPFPTKEVMNYIPSAVQQEIIEGMLGADLIGFHIDEYKNNFLNTAKAVLSVSVSGNTIVYKWKASKTGSFPMGIDFRKYQKAVFSVKEPTVGKMSVAKKEKVFLSVDRLDYTKGITNKLWAFEILLDRYQEWQQFAKLVMIVAPSRTDVVQNMKVKDEIDELVRDINQRYGCSNWLPIEYHYSQVDFADLIIYYANADIALVTPIKDGMNLVAKEYISSRTKRDGVLILSKEAGAREELAEALLVDPAHISHMAELMNKALCMKRPEQKSRTTRMQMKIKKNDVFKWVADILNQTVLSSSEVMKVSPLNHQSINLITQRYAKAKKRVLFLDYDGTLVPLAADPAAAVPDDELLHLLSKIAIQSNTKIIIVSGRDAAFLEASFRKINIDYAAEYGSVLKRNHLITLGGNVKEDWKTEAKSIIDELKLPAEGSFLEEKDYSLVVHFKRNSITKLDNYFDRFDEVFRKLKERYFLEVIHAKDSVEIKHAAINKGTAIAHWMGKENYDFLLAIGDHNSDEDMFKALPANAFSIRVGHDATCAHLRATDYLIIRKLLKKLSCINEKSKPSPVPYR